MKKLEQIISDLPKKPWVYLFKDSWWKIIYIWKSVNLKSRVSSYFNWKSKLNFAKQEMVKKIVNLDFIETKNELEALVLETNLIKKNKPKFNIMMKDDKNLTYIKITNDPIPEVIKTRIKSWQWHFFWPYTSMTNVASMLAVLKKAFKVRSCRIVFKDTWWKVLILSNSWNRSTPCLDHYIWLCPAPCLLEESKIKEYISNMESLKDFLKWDTWSVLRELTSRMEEKSKAYEFEEAAKIRDQIKDIKELTEKQVARDKVQWDSDAIVAFQKNGKSYIWLVEVRWSEIVSVISSKAENGLEEDLKTILIDYIRNRYVWSWIRWIKLILQEDIDDKTILKYLNSESISVEIPSAWSKLELLSFVKLNLMNFAYKEELSSIAKISLTKWTQKNILEALGFEITENKEIIFECYDISHLSWTNTVASKSVIVNWKSDNSKYRKYKVNTLAEWEIDDFKSMREVLSRRTNEAIRAWSWPDLIVIDWGKWQLSAAYTAIEEMIVWTELKMPNICSIAKREEEVFVIWNKDPIIFSKWTPELSLLQKIRDEAHRFAISFNRSKRIKDMKKNILEEIPWLWPKARSKLLKLAWNVDNLKNMPIDELKKIINSNQIKALEDHWII